MDLNAVEVRVLGCLIEKQRTTPDQYPLSLNSLRLACYRRENQARSILIVEDDAATRDSLRRALEPDGWAIDEAENGQIGLARVEKSRPGVILLDLMMPEMDGFEFITELRRHEEWRSIPVVVITARDLTGEDHRRLNGYVAATVQKSAYDREALLTEVRDLLATSLPHPATRREV